MTDDEQPQEPTDPGELDTEIQSRSPRDPYDPGRLETVETAKGRWPLGEDRSEDDE